MKIQKTIAAGLIFCLVCLSSAQQGVAGGISDQIDTLSLKQKVDLFGVGADVKAKLVGGQKLKGEISSISDSGFELISKQYGEPHYIAYDQVAKLELSSPRRAGSRISNTAEARRVIAALGVGRHVLVRTDQVKIHGRIMAIEEDHFVILPDDRNAPVRIAYMDLQKAGKNLGILSTIGLVVVIIAVVAVIKWTR